MQDNAFQIGNTVRLECAFKDFDGMLTDPTIVKIIFYNFQYKKINEITLNENHRVDVGRYQYDYVTPIDQEKRIYIEWYGEIAGVPSINRTSIRTTFI